MVMRCLINKIWEIAGHFQDGAIAAGKGWCQPRLSQKIKCPKIRPPEFGRRFIAGDEIAGNDIHAAIIFRHHDDAE